MTDLCPSVDCTASVGYERPPCVVCPALSQRAPSDANDAEQTRRLLPVEHS